YSIGVGAPARARRLRAPQRRLPSKRVENFSVPPYPTVLSRFLPLIFYLYSAQRERQNHENRARRHEQTHLRTHLIIIFSIAKPVCARGGCHFLFFARGDFARLGGAAFALLGFFDAAFFDLAGSFLAIFFAGFFAGFLAFAFFAG